MTNNKYLLSICIPTYNRYKILCECINYIKESFKQYKSDVIIIVIDNDSTDSTKLISNDKSIIYIKNDRNIGGDMNILKCYQIAKLYSKYACVTGDSYHLTGNIKSLIDILRNNQYDEVIINRFNMFKTKKYNDINNLVAELGGIMDLTGTIVVRTNAVEENNYNMFYNSNFIHTCMTLTYLSKLQNAKCVLLGDVGIDCTKINRDSISWYANMVRIFSENWVNSILSLPNIKTEDKLKCIKSHSRYTSIFSLETLLLNRYKRFINIEVVEKYAYFLPLVSDVPYNLIKIISKMNTKIAYLLYVFIKIIGRLRKYIVLFQNRLTPKRRVRK